MYKHCQNCGEVLAKDRLYERHCSWACRNADLPAAEHYANIRLSEAEMLDLCVAIACRKSRILETKAERDLEDWEKRLWVNLTSIDDKCSRQLMRMNKNYLDSPNGEMPLRVVKGEKQ